MKNKILWLISARSGSKSIPNKNIKFLGGHPLLSYRIVTALNTIIEKEVWLSTDSKEYGLIGQKYGAKLPFIRPMELSDDNSTSVDVVLHAMQYAIETSQKFDFIGLLEPTSPFISTLQLNNAISKLVNEPNADSIIAVKESRPNTIFIQDDSKYLDKIALEIENLQTLGRQNFVKQITPSGGFYISRWNNFLHNKTFYTKNSLGFFVDEISGIEIDEPIDFLFAQFLIEKNKFNLDVKF